MTGANWKKKRGKNRNRGVSGERGDRRIQELKDQSKARTWSRHTIDMANKVTGSYRDNTTRRKTPTQCSPRSRHTTCAGATAQSSQPGFGCSGRRASVCRCARTVDGKRASRESRTCSHRTRHHHPPLQAGTSANTLCARTFLRAIEGPRSGARAARVKTHRGCA